MFKLDKTDQDLLAILRSNARTSVVDLAKKLGVSRATVQNRMRRLEKERVILGYTVSLRPEVETYPVRAHMSIKADSKKEASVIAALRGNPHVTKIYHTNGRWDLVTEMRTDTLSSFNSIVGAIRLIDGVTATETNLLLDSYE